jgi:uncharacterized protein YhaN
MKILRIDLIAFGPFSDVSLDFSEGDEGLHLIYGPNEAGKSSALRAVRNLLFGIPERSSDDFLHPYGKLRIGGVLRSSAGATIECIRRKGRANTLRARDDSTVVDESVLAQVLGGVDGDDFSRRFGIDHQALVQGGREIVEGRGELAAALFAAGSGIAGFRTIQEALKSEMDSLFKPAAQKPRINEALALRKEDQKRLRHIELSSGDWLRHDEALRETAGRKRTVQAQIEEKERERGRLARILKALPVIGRRKSLLSELDRYPGTVILPAGFSEKRQGLVTELRIEEQNEQRAASELSRIEQDLAGLSVPDLLIARSAEIDELYRELGSHQKAGRDRPKLASQREALEEQARELLAGLRKGFPIEQVEELRVESAQQVLIRKLGEARSKHYANLDNALQKIRDLSGAIDKLERQLEGEEPPDFSGLKIAVEEAVRHGPIEEMLASSLAEARKLESEAETGIEALGLWTGELNAIEKLPVPDVETIDDFDSRIRDIETEIRSLETEAGRIGTEALEVQRAIAQLRSEQEIPTEDDLRLSREKRDAGWRLVRRAADPANRIEADEKEFTESVPGAESLFEAFEAVLRHADETADRLRREAGRVARYAALISDAENRAAQLERTRQKSAEAGSRLEKALLDWEKLWAPSGVAPLSPRQMRRWAAKQKDLTVRAARIRDLKAEAASRNASVTALAEGLRKGLAGVSRVPPEGENLARLLTRGREAVEAFEAARAERDLLTRDLLQRRFELDAAQGQEERAQSGLDEWRRDWEEAVKPLGLGGESIPDQADAILTRHQELFAKLREAKQLRARIEGIDRDVAEFGRQVRALAAKVAPELKDLPAEEAVSGLYHASGRAKLLKTRKEDLEKRQRAEHGRKAEAARSVARLTAQLGVMCEEAHCAAYEELPEAERSSARRRELTGQVEQLDAQLLDLAAGLPIGEFIAEAETEDSDSLAPRIGRLNEEIEGLNAEKSGLDQAIGKETAELLRMDGRADAADLAQEMQAHLAGLETGVRQYSRLKIASVIVAEAMERYRQKSQGPVLARAGEFFRSITRGSFEGLRVETDESGAMVIAGVRPGGTGTVKVEGMSDGTADQIYLALRLASIEQHCQSAEPLPFILDDILIRFDDGRAAATLNILAALSKKTQVIFFTHHLHLLEIAKSAIPGPELFVHRLGPG